MSEKKQSPGQSNANESNGDNKSSSLDVVVKNRLGEEVEETVDREKIDGTPFYVERTSEKEGYYLRMGRHRLTIERLETKEEAIEYINYNMYDLLLKMVIAVMQDRDEIENLKTQN